LAEEGGRPAATVEVERKFRVHGLFRLAGVRLPDGWSLGTGSAQTLDATYFDSGDLRLSRARLTLRRRVGGADEGWHLKLPLGGEAREELAVPLGRGTPDSPPPELCDLVVPFVRSARLEVVARLLTERTTYAVLAPEGDVTALLTDDSVSVFDGDRVVARFRELEVELDAGADTEVLDLVGAALVDAGAIQGGTISKVSRALGPLATSPADVPEPMEVGPGDPARLAVQGLIRRYTRALLVHDIGVRRDLDDSVHQMRVAASLLRSGLKVFEPLLDVEVTSPLLSDLAWLAAVLGQVRDREVLSERLLRDLDELAADPHLEIDPAGARKVVATAFAASMTDARAEVLAALRSPRYLALLDTLVSVSSVPPTSPAAEQACSSTLPPLVSRAWRRLARDVRRLELDGPDKEWHETRIAAKKARYACEAVEPVFGKPARRLAENVELVTELLGEHQDASIAATTIQDLARRRGVGTSTAFVLGLLCAQQRSAVEETRQELIGIWPEVSRRRWRRWLRPGGGR
jgi:CHAD domain-containing protein